jgi:hypothetical protein
MRHFGFLAKQLLFSVAVLASSQSLAIDEKEAVLLGRNFLSKPALSLESETLKHLEVELQTYSTLKSSDKTLWLVSNGHQDVYLNNDTGDVVLYSNGDVYEKSSGKDRLSNDQRQRPFYHAREELVAHARAIIQELGWIAGTDVEIERLPAPDKDGKVARCRVYVTFYERPNGIESRSGGNFVNIGFDVWNGEVVEFLRRSGHTVASADVKVSKSEALQIAREATELLPNSEAYGPTYVDLDGAGFILSERAVGFAKRKILPLAYTVRGKTEMVTIAADNGEILARHDSRIAGSEAPLPPARREVGGSTSGKTKGLPTDVTLLGGLLALVALAGGFIYTRLRLKK